MRVYCLRLFSLFILLSINLFSQTFNGTGGTIPDNSPPVFFPITVSSLTGSLTSQFGLINVCIRINHNYDSDLIVKIVAPDNTEITLAYENGGSGNNFTNTCFDMSATTSISQGSAPFTGSYRPIGLLGNINNGQAANGIWQLKVEDNDPGTTGSLVNWSLTFGANAPVPFVFNVTNLPIVVINTNGQTLVDSPSKIVQFGIINNSNHINHPTDAFNDYDAYALMQFRGSSSQQFPKKSFNVSFCNAIGTELDSAVMGMPSEHDFALVANYSDKTFLRNALAYTLWDKSGHYGTRYQHCEVVINGDYQGIYVFTEKLKRDKNRLDISKLDFDDNAGDSITGGYIVKIDKTTGAGGLGFTSIYPPLSNGNGQTTFYQYDYPSETVITDPQKNYIKAYIDSFEYALNSASFMDSAIGWRKFADEEHFIDFILVNEFSKNVDGYRISTYLNKQKKSKGGLLRAGPVWDFDIAFGNADYCEGGDTAGWAYNFGDVCGTAGNQIAFYWKKLWTDTIFKMHMKCRWDLLKQEQYSLSYINNYIDSMVSMITLAANRNFTVWPILGVYVWPNNYVGNSLLDEANYLKQYIASRYRFLDENIIGNCNLASTNDNVISSTFRVFPTIFDDFIRTSNLCEISIYNLLGSEVFNQKSMINNQEINLKFLNSGIYILQAKTFNGKIIKQKVIKK